MTERKLSELMDIKREMLYKIRDYEHEDLLRHLRSIEKASHPSFIVIYIYTPFTILPT